MLKLFPAIFQNIKPGKYITTNSICSNDINDSLLLLHLNIRSLQKNLGDLCEFISGLSKQPHIICISEAKIKNSTVALINISISSYEFVNVDSFTNAGGVGVYITESFQHEKVALEPHFDGCEL